MNNEGECLSAHSTIGAVILAAGLSSRMKQFKPLLKFGALTAVERAILTFQDAGVSTVCVVVGHRGEEVAECVRPLKVEVLWNPDYEKGMYTSIQRGVAGLPSYLEGFFLLPADYPLVKSQTVAALAEAFHRGDKGIIHPLWRGQQGHPPLISTKYNSSINASTFPGGLRQLLAENIEDTREIDVSDEGILWDMDLPEDYGFLLKQWRQQPVPDKAMCYQLLQQQQVPQAVYQHSVAVAELAMTWGKALLEQGAHLSLELVRAGALLHDIARQEPHHAEVGARLLRQWGFWRVADIVALHMDRDICLHTPITEGELVFLADKMTHGRERTSLQERMSSVEQRFQGNSEALAAAKRRLEAALAAQNKLERVLGHPLTEIAPGKS